MAHPRHRHHRRPHDQPTRRSHALELPTNFIGSGRPNGYAGLEIFRPPQGTESLDGIPLGIEVTVGEQTFTEADTSADHDGYGIKLSFRRVIVALYPENYEVERQRRYERTVSPEDFRQAVKELSEAKSETGMGGEAKASADGTLFARFALGAGLFLNGSQQSTTTRAIDIETVARCDIVAYRPGPRWEIGRFITDALENREGPIGELYGRFFHLPANGPATGVEETDLCHLVADGDAGFRVTVELRAKLADCVVKPVGPMANGDPREMRNKTLIEQRLGIKMLQDLNRETGYDPPPDEVILSRGTLAVTPKEDGT